MTVNYLALQKRNVGLVKNEFDDQLFCNFMLVPDQGWNSNYNHVLLNEHAHGPGVC